MINLGGTDFYIAVPSLPQHEFEQYSTDLFDEWEKHIELSLKLPDYSLSLEVEEGSIKGTAKITATLGALYLGIAQYGSFISALQIIHGQVSSIGEFLASRASAPFPSDIPKPKTRKNSGSLGQLQKLFIKVQKGELSVDQAMIAAEKIIGEEALETPEFMADLKISLESTPSLAQQLELTFNTFEQVPTIPELVKKTHSRSPRPKPELPISQQFRVEVWRESKKEKRKFRLVKL